MNFSKTISQKQDIKIFSELYLTGWNPVLGSHRDFIKDVERLVIFF